jgi:hypothetical protein
MANPLIGTLTDNFSTAPVGYSVTGTVDGSFMTIGGTNVDVLSNPGTFGSLCNSGNSECIDLGGSTGNSLAMGTLSSSSQFGPGAYLLSFDLNGAQRGTTTTTTVSLGSYSQTFTLLPGDTTSGDIVNQYVTLTSPGYLVFSDTGSSNDNIGAVLDSVNVAPTPEPPSIILLGSALLMGAGFFAMRRRQQALSL